MVVQYQDVEIQSLNTIISILLGEKRSIIGQKG